MGVNPWLHKLSNCWETLIISCYNGILTDKRDRVERQKKVDIWNIKKEIHMLKNNAKCINVKISNQHPIPFLQFI